MKRSITVAVCSLALVFAAGACKKKEQPPQPQTGAPGQQMPAGHPAPGTPGMPGQPGMPPGQPGTQQPGQQPVVMPKGEVKVVLPDSVKGKWKAVVLAVEDKQAKKTADYTVNIGSDFKVPNSNLKITVGEFLPDFKMNGLDITSASNDTNNPAVGVRIYDGSTQIFPAPGKKWGWLYGRPEFRTMHPFENAKYGINLKNAVKKG